MNQTMRITARHFGSRAGEIFVSGTVSALTAFPLSIGFALLAGVPPIIMVLASVYSALFNAALAGRYGVGGPNTAVAMLTGAALMPFAPAESSLYLGYVFALCVLVGIYQLLFSLLLRKIDLMDYVSNTVIDGISFGIGAMFVLTSLWMVAGLAQPGGAQWTPFHALMSVDRTLEGSGNSTALMVSGITIAIGILFWQFKKSKRFAILIGLVAGFIAAQFLDDKSDLEYIGWLSVPLFTTSLPDFRQVSWPVIFNLAGGPALAIALVGMLQTLSIAKTIRDPDEPYRPDREILSQGLQHIFMGFFSGAPVSNSFNKSALKRDLGGGRSSQLFSAVVTVAMIYLAADLVADIPMSALGGALILVGIGMLNIRKYNHHLGSGSMNSVLFFLPATLVVVMDIQSALLMGFVLSLLVHFWKVSKPNVVVETHTARDGRPVSVITIDGGLFFGSVRHVARELAQLGEKEDNNIFLLRTDHLTYIDVPGVMLLAEEAKRRRARGDEIYIYVTRSSVLKMIEDAGLLKIFGEQNLIHRTLDHPMKYLLHPKPLRNTDTPMLEKGRLIQDLVKHLHTLRLFSNIPLKQLNSLLENCTIESASAGAILMKEDVSLRMHFILIDGEVEAERSWRTQDGRDDSVSWKLAPPETGMRFSFLGSTSRVRVRALTDVRYLTIDGDLIDELAGWNQRFAEEFQDNPELQRRMGLIKQIGIFRDLPLENVSEVFKHMRQREMQAGETVISQGEKGDAFYLIDTGEAEIIRTDPFTEETHHVAQLGPGDSFGEESLLQEGYRNATVNMITPGQLLVLDKSDFDELIRPTFVEEVTAEQAMEMIKSGKASWIDCRYDMEYEESHIPGATLLPLDSIRSQIHTLDPDATYVVYCRSGRRSKAAAFILRERNFKAMSMAGGIKGWPFEVEVSST